MKRIIVICIFGLLLSGCRSNEKLGVASDEQEVLLDVSVLGAPRTTGSPSKASADQVIAQLDLLVFKDGKYQYRKEAFPSDGKFRSTLKIDQGLTIYFLANSRAVLDGLGNTLSPGTDWLADIRPNLISASPVLETDGMLLLPMWGEKSGVNLSQGVVNNMGSISLLRSVASTDIMVDAGVTNFELKEARVYFAASQGLLAPLEIKYNADNELDMDPESPSTMQTNVTVSASTVENNSIVHQLYMFENDTDLAAAGRTGRRFTRVVVGGLYDGSTEMTYYPLDFVGENNTVLPVTRNNKYKITITKVNGGGYGDPDVASMATPVNMDFEVIRWNYFEDSDIVIDGPDYLSVEGKRAVVERYAGRYRDLSISTTFDLSEIGMKLNQTANGSIQEVENGIKNDRFMARILTGADGSTFLRITALGDYVPGSTTANADVLTITASRVTFDIDIVQINEGADDWGDGGNMDIEGLTKSE